MAQFSPETASIQSESLSPVEIQADVASLGPVFDLVIEQGNGHADGAALNTSRLLVSPFYDSRNAGVRSLQGLAYAEDGTVEGKMIFTGNRDGESENFSWKLTKYPVSSVEPTEEALRLAEQYIVPIARVWQSLPQGEQELYLDQLTRQHEEAPRKHTLRSMARIITRLGRA